MYNFFFFPCSKKTVDFVVVKLYFYVLMLKDSAITLCILEPFILSEAGFLPLLVLFLCHYHFYHSWYIVISKHPFLFNCSLVFV